MCMAFYPRQFCSYVKPTITLGTIPLKWVSTHKYLGVIISEDLKDDCDIKRQMKGFYARGNTVIRNFKSCSTSVKIQLFKTYFSSIYGGHLWSSYSKVNFNKLKVAYNNIFRLFMNLKRDCSISQAYVENNVHNFEALLRVFMGSFINRIVKSNNKLVTCLIESVYFMCNSKLLTLWNEKAYVH